MSIEEIESKIQIQINAYIQIDYNEKFGEKGITGSMGRLLFKHVLKNDILLRHEDTLYAQTYDLAGGIKKFLNFEAE